MPLNRRQSFAVIILIGLVALGGFGFALWWLNGDGFSGSRPRAAQGNVAAAASPAPSRPPQSAAEEIACVDRLIAAPVPDGENMQAAFERCRYVPAPDANLANAAPPPAVNGAAGR
jgi:hypothetical protein